MSKLKEKYNQTIKQQLYKDLKLKNVTQIPSLKKIVLNVGVGEAVQNSKAIEIVQQMLTAISGQKAVVSKAKKSISNFKVRQGMEIGSYVTLRGENMWDFYSKLVEVVIPRIKDFRGLNPDAFDKAGNYTLGIKDHTIFPEVDPNEIDKIRSLEITIVTTTSSKEDSRALMLALGLPLKKSTK